jgi:stress-induced morphogen
MSIVGRARSVVRLLSTLSEQDLKSKILASLPGSSVDVEDVSNGCGAMFKVSVSSQMFQGKGLVRKILSIVD